MSVVVSSAPRYGNAKLRALARWLPLALLTGFLAKQSISRVLERLGHPGASLDDAYIHFQYARALAEGHPFQFQVGEPISTGATSFLWPVLLAPFYALGLQGESILWAAWALSYLALGALAWEAYALAWPLTGRGPAVGAGAMVLGFGGFAWFAASGMEGVAFAWVIAAATRRACLWAEDGAWRTKRRFLQLLALAFACPLARPEGALTAVAVGVVVFAWPLRGGLAMRGRDLSRGAAAAFLFAAVFPNVLLFLLTGRATSSTTQVKLLSYSPYASVIDATLANARLLVTEILDGGPRSAEFLPSGGAVIALAGLVAIVWRGHATGRLVRSALLLLLALSMFVPCTYVTFLWNRLRYLWPFATAWFVGLACFARIVGDAARRFDARIGAAVGTLLSGAFAGALAMRLDWVIEDVAQSASGIDRQQVALGRWANASLSADARIGVNDTGAIAYFGNRKTFDVVGLTTPSEGRHWVAGVGSRLEHYERLRASSPASLPTHFIVYPEWMGCEPVIGKFLHDAVVSDSTILGGERMRATEARWDLLGSGERPWTPTSTVIDTLDVADIESEREHRYALLGAREGEQAAEEGNAPDGAIVVDGGRTNRGRDRFEVRLPPGGPLRLVARVASAASTAVRLAVDGKDVDRAAIEAGPWVEVSFTIPETSRGAESGNAAAVDVIADGPPFTSFHYWVTVP